MVSVDVKHHVYLLTMDLYLPMDQAMDLYLPMDQVMDLYLGSSAEATRTGGPSATGDAVYGSLSARRAPSVSDTLRQTPG